jgi:exonuclease VII small subunit
MTDADTWDEFEDALDRLLNHVVEGDVTAREAEKRLQQRAQGLREMYEPVDADHESHR